MSQIDSGEVKMRPKSYFVFKKWAKIAGVGLIILMILVAVFYSVVVIQNGVFKEYLEFGKQGSGIYWSSLPWGAIIISVLLTIAVSLGIYLIQQKKQFVPTLVGSFVAVALVAAVIFRIGPDPNTSALARAVVGVDGYPTKIAGTVEEKSGDTIKVKSSDGKIITIKINSSTLGNKEFELGDEVLVLGNEQNGSVNANAIKTTKKAEKKVVEVKQAEPTKTEPEEKPAEETKPEQKPTATAPIVTTPTTPTTPPPPVPTSLSGSIAVSQDATYVYVIFNLNMASTGKCIAHFKQGATVINTSYTVLSSPNASCFMKIKKIDLGANGTWNVDAYFKYPINDWSNHINKQGSITI